MDKFRRFLAAPFYFLAIIFFIIGMIFTIPMLLISAFISHGPAKIKAAWIKAGEDVDNMLGD